MSTFSYSKLPKETDIRVLVIQPGAIDAPIHANLRVWDGTEPYEALSWSWGALSPSISIQIINENGQREPLLIKSNLEVALKSLRRQDGPRSLWIDAICKQIIQLDGANLIRNLGINQSDLEERSGQVSMMRDIYGEATNVCIWLGNEEEDSKMAMDFIQNEILPLDTFDELINPENTEYSKKWEALAKLMRREWFSRRWVVQEIALARRATVHCGPSKVNWNAFADAVALFESRESRDNPINQMLMRVGTYGFNPQSLGDIPALPASRLVRATNELFRRTDDGRIKDLLYTLEGLVSELGPFQSSRPHDVIYAVLGLSSDVKPQKLLRLRGMSELEQAATKLKRNMQVFMMVGGAKLDEFPVDYDKPALEVFKIFMKIAVQRSDSLDIMCRPWAPDRELDEDTSQWKQIPLPSWIPKLSKQPFERQKNGKMLRKNPDILVGDPVIGRKTYNASGSEKMFYFIDLSNDRPPTMKVDGFILGKIDSLYESAQFGNVPASWLEAGGWVDDTDLPQESLWRTMVADRGPNGSNPPRWYPRAFAYGAKELGVSCGFNIHTLIHHTQCSIVAELFRRVYSVIFNRRLFTAVWRGMQAIGLAPLQAQKGDLICILYGCSVPVCIRPKRSRKRQKRGTDADPTDNVPRTPQNNKRKRTTLSSGPPFRFSGIEGSPEQLTFDDSQTVQHSGVEDNVNPVQETRSEGVLSEYEFIGECYVHEFMDGNAIEIKKRHNLPKQRFILV